MKRKAESPFITIWIFIFTIFLFTTTFTTAAAAQEQGGSPNDQREAFTVSPIASNRRGSRRRSRIPVYKRKSRQYSFRLCLGKNSHEGYLS